MELHSNDMMNLINLQVLDLSYNNLIYMPQLTLPALITLSVTSCGLESVEYAFLKASRNLRQLLIDGNPIICSQHPLDDIEQCYDMQTLSNEYINDDYDIPLDIERHFNFISSYFANDGGIEKCGRQSSVSAKEIVPNCWSEQKLITSFKRTNEKVATTSSDNKFFTNNSGNPSNEIATTPMAIKDVTMKNFKTTNNKNSSAAMQMNNLILMKAKQFKADGNSIQLSALPKGEKYSGKSTSSSENSLSIKTTVTLQTVIKSTVIPQTTLKSTVAPQTTIKSFISSSTIKPIETSTKIFNLNLKNQEEAEVSQHPTANQTISEHWNAMRVETLKHPGLLIVFTISSIGVFLTIIAVYVYRCNTRVRHLRSNEGTRDILNDNFNEEIHSFTIESHRCESIIRDRNDNLLTTSSTVNQCDLLPMDILNSTLNQSQTDRGHISMHLW